MGTLRARRSAGVVVVLATLAALPACSGTDDCTPDLGGRASVARVWDEVILDGIRRDFPAPPAHARNLYHLSAAMWDAWAAFDPAARGVFVDEDHEADDVTAAREEAMSYAAYRVIAARYAEAIGAEETLAGAREALEDLCLSPDVETTEGDSPAAIGNRIGAGVLAASSDDGSLEANGYIDDSYEPVNPPLQPRVPGTEIDDPDRWQPLDLDRAIGQNGVPLPNGVQRFVGSQWGNVTPFSLPEAADGMPIDPGDFPHLAPGADGDGYREGALEVLRLSGRLDPRGADQIDISPGALGDNTVGTNDGDGHDENPQTRAPYPPNVVNEADFARVLAEFWADGPASETPPGHWNTLANGASDRLRAEDLRIEGAGAPVDRLEWDTKLYLALNGALHDAAIAAWGAKRQYDSVRPISMIRLLGQNGQSSDPSGPSYSPLGLPLERGLVEVATAASVAPGGRHAASDAAPGEIVVRAWTGAPGEEGIAGVDWIRAVEWVPYQKPTFVTPAFPGYVSGHSTFSRAAAEILTAFTGSEFFPGGIEEYTEPAGDLEFEDGPTEDVTLQWATYADAADQAGISRLYGGIHVRADDFAGRLMGRQVGLAAWEHAQDYFDGTGR